MNNMHPSIFNSKPKEKSAFNIRATLLLSVGAVPFLFTRLLERISDDALRHFGYTFALEADIFLFLSVFLKEFLFPSLTFRDILVFMGLLVLSFVFYRSENYNWMIPTIFLIFSSRNVNSKKIIFFLSLFVSLFLLFIVTEYEFGLLPPAPYTTYENSIRNSFGFLYPTFAPKIFFFLTIAYVLIQKRALTFGEMIILFVLNLYFFIESDTVSAFICSIFVIVFGFLNRFKIASFWRHPSIRFIPLALAAISYFSCFAYRSGNPWIINLNALFSNRIRLGYNGIQEFGLHLFAHPIVMHAYQTNPIFDSAYNYVDMGYVQYTLVFGLVFLVVWLFAFYRLIEILQKQGDIGGITAVIAVALFTFSDPEILNIECNPALLLFALVFSRVSPLHKNNIAVNTEKPNENI
ncbi:membrane hypothetical protein [Oenococcus oeni]|uniref:hypothetical protein n=1 Tax=Oenococcus oeni TaxID=1247 RepID=UPI0010B0A3EF|nr:hypothetical protein [Oenococcus oeni]SYW12248.1 membrane hypothetical protein [Oenococcus oeni]